MMRVCLLGSGSSGNCIYIGDENGAILLDAGFSAKEIKKRLEIAGLNPLSIKGIVVSHEHSDHSKGAGVLSRNLDIPVFVNEKTFERIESRIGRVKDLVHFETGESFDVGGIGVSSFTIPHDAVDPCAFTFRTNGTSTAVITDVGVTTTLMENRAKEVDYLVVEANHNYEILMAGPYPWELKKRIASREGHLSNEQCADFLDSVVDSRLQGVAFAHLSETNNNPELVKQVADEKLGDKGIPYDVAGQDKPGNVVVVE